MQGVHLFSSRRVRWLVCLLVLLVPIAGMAQSALTAADRAEVKAFTFNNDVFTRLQKVVTQTRDMHIKRGQMDMSKVHSLDDLAKQLVASDSRTKPLLATHGFTPHQFLVANLALVATVGPLHAAQTPQQRERVKSQLNPVNVRFYEAHKTQMNQLVFPAGAAGQ